VPNRYCTNYFDDEDFVYFKLKIPKIILDHLINTPKAHNNYSELDYVQKLIYDIHMQDKNIDTFENFDTYVKILNIYSNVIKFYNQINSHQRANWSLFGNNLNNTLDDIFDKMRNQICFDYMSPTYKDMSKIYREITFGIRLIISQLDIIRNYYRKHNISFQYYSVKHQNRFIRLLNNFCVLMIFLKFNIFDLKEDYSQFIKYNMDIEGGTREYDDFNNEYGSEVYAEYPIGNYNSSSMMDIVNDTTYESFEEMSSARYEDF
jgi:hypothetical protein